MAGFGRIILQFFAIFTLLLCYVLRPKDKFWPIFPPHTMSIPMEFLSNQSINKIGNILKKWWWIWVVSDHCRTFPKFPPPRVHKSRTSKSIRNICCHFFHKKSHPSGNYIDFLVSNTLTMIFAVKIIVWQQDFRHIHRHRHWGFRFHGQQRQTIIIDDWFFVWETALSKALKYNLCFLSIFLFKLCSNGNRMNGILWSHPFSLLVGTSSVKINKCNQVRDAL